MEGGIGEKVGKWLPQCLDALCFWPQQGRLIPGAYKFDALITTFEMILSDCPELREIEWRCVIIDEAHRLKNRNCKLLDSLKHMDLVGAPRSPSALPPQRYVGLPACSYAGKPDRVALESVGSSAELGILSFAI